MGRSKEKKLLLLATAAVCLARRARRRKSPSCWVRSWMARRDQHSFKTLISELEVEDPAEFRSMFRMDKENFDFILNLVAPHIAKQDTVIRQSISPRERLQVTLRYLATG